MGLWKAQPGIWIRIKRDPPYFVQNLAVFGIHITCSMPKQPSKYNFHAKRNRLKPRPEPPPGHIGFLGLGLEPRFLLPYWVRTIGGSSRPKALAAHYLHEIARGGRSRESPQACNTSAVVSRFYRRFCNKSRVCLCGLHQQSTVEQVHPHWHSLHWSTMEFHSSTSICPLYWFVLWV